MISWRRRLLFSSVLGLVISFCYVAGYSLDRFMSLDLMSGNFYVSFLLSAFLASFLVLCFFLLVEKINGISKRQNENNLAENSQSQDHVYKEFRIPHMICVVLLLLCWLPALLSIWPGAFNYDAYAEWQQVAQGNITAHHPVLHVLAAGGLVEVFYNLTGNFNVGIAVYTILQMVILANLLARVIAFLEEFRFGAGIQIFTLAFFGLSPVVQLFAVSVTKDTLFAAVEVLFFLYSIRFYCQREMFCSEKKHLLGFCITAFFTMILRNNGLYIVLFTLVVMVVSYIRGSKKYGRSFWMALAGIFLLYGLYVGPFYNALNVTAGGVEEMLSVPVQQMARVHRYDYDSLEQEDLELLYQFISKDALDNYRSTVSDFVKAGFNKKGFEENKVAFFKLWAKWLKEYPLTYINSFLINTVDFWYPHAVLDGYQDAYGKSSFFDYQVDLPGTEVVILKGAHDFYEALSHDVEAQKVPLAFLVLSPGWYLLFAIVVFAYLWCYKRTEFIVPMLILAVSLFTVLLGPIALVRYVLIFYFVFPVLVAILFRGEKFRR